MGYDSNYFLCDDGEGVDETLLCPICQSVYDTPMVIDPCGHSFCKECVKELLDSGHENCPVCRTKMIERGGIPPNRALKGLISNMKIRCMNCPDDSDISTRGCSWTGRLSDFPSHSENDCPLYMVSCPIEGCDFVGPRSAMLQHNIDNIALHTDLIVAAKLEKIKGELLGAAPGLSSPDGISAISSSNHGINELKERLDEQDREIDTLKARLLDNWLSGFFREWILAKPPYFSDFVIYRPIKYLTGPISQIIVGIPGPGRSDWEGGLYPLLVTFTPEGFERKEPPKCDFPETFFHPNVYEGNVHVNTLVEFEGS